MNLAPREEREILDEIRNDRELIDRLKISSDELEALSKCVLLGTLTCKQDMLFILRVIREANGPAVDKTAVIAQPNDLPAEEEQEEEEPAQDLRRIVIPAAPAIALEPGSFEGIVRRRMPEQFGVLFWVLVAVVGFAWNAVSVMSRWRDTFTTTIGSAPIASAAATTWYTSLDRFNLLLSWEILFVAGVTIFTYFKSRSGTRRLKVRPGRSSR